MAKKQKQPAHTYDELLEMAVAKCRETGGMPSRRSWTHDSFINFEDLKQVLGKGDWNRAEKVIREAYQGKDVEPKKKAKLSAKGEGKMTDNELFRYQNYTEVDWLEWLHRAGGGKLLREESIQTKRPEQYDIIMEVFNGWENVKIKFDKKYGQKQPDVTAAPKNEQPETQAQQTAPAPQSASHTPDELLNLAIQECVKQGTMLSDPKWMTITTLDFEEIVMVLGDGSWDAAKFKIERAWKQYENAQNVKEAEKMTGLNDVEGTPKKERKERVNMSEVEMRKFVLEAMKTLGERPSKAMYDVYAKEHGGVTAVSLAHHGLGISKWPQIAAEERAKLPEETLNVTEEPEQKPLEEAAPSGDAGSLREAEVPEAPVQQERDAIDILQVMVHGIDATVMIGGLEVQVRLDFGAKK